MKKKTIFYINIAPLNFGCRLSNFGNISVKLGQIV